MRVFEIRDGFDEFRSVAKTCIEQGFAPEHVRFVEPGGEGDLFSQLTIPSDVTNWVRDPSYTYDAGGLLEKANAKFFVPAKFMDIARDVAHHKSPDKWTLIYRLLWRITHETRHLLEIATDDDVIAAHHMQKAVSREIHKVHAFVRFQKTEDPEGRERYVAWIKTEHPVLPLAVPLFVRRFGDKPWSILSPQISAHWDTHTLCYGDGVEHQPQREESLDDLWKSYYRSIFNPARLKVKAMKSEMPMRYWGALPETDLIEDLIREVPERLTRMAERQNKEAVPPKTRSIEELKAAAGGCRACPLGDHATQTVFGEGPLNASLMIIGEQPGDEEDLAGKPFVGPAGKVFDRAMKTAGVSRAGVYLTNAVKHFKWKPGPPAKPRLHQKPSGSEMHACRPWLEREIDLVRPTVIVCMGQTAATSLLGRMVKITDEIGKVHRDTPWASHVLITYHPSAILRAPSPEEGARMQAELERTLVLAGHLASFESRLSASV